jgi:hypothetical protein
MACVTDKAKDAPIMISTPEATFVFLNIVIPLRFKEPFFRSQSIIEYDNVVNFSIGHKPVQVGFIEAIANSWTSY